MVEVLIIGAGIGGVAAARALTADGHRVTVFERAETMRNTGAALTMWSNGTGILNALGVSLNGFGAPIDALEQRDRHGRTLTRIDVTRSATVYGHPTIALPRHRLLEQLAADLPRGTIAFGHTCTGFTQDDGGVTAKFANGATAHADLLIGADGHHSIVRDHLWGADPSEPSGWATWQGLTRIPIEVTASRHCVLIVGREGLCGLLPAGEGLLQWWFDMRWSPGDATPTLPDLRRRFGHWTSPVPEVLAAVDDGDLGFFPHYRHRVPRRWGTGRITLAGDSAHTMPPTRAQGANQALEDVWTLATTLRTTPDLPSALRTYERARSKPADLVARHAGSEDIDKYRPLLSRLLPDLLVSAYYTRWLKQISNYLQRDP